LLVVKAFQRQETQLSPHRNMQQEQRLLSYNLLDGMNRLSVFFQLRKARLTRVHSPSTTMDSCRLPKNRKQTHWAVKEASKAGSCIL